MLLTAVALPAVGAALLFILRLKQERLRNILVMFFTTATSAIIACCLFTPGDHQMTLLRITDDLTLSFRLDGLGRTFSGLVAFLWPLATLYGLEYMRHEGGENIFFGYYLLSYTATLGIAFSEDMMTLYVFYELLTLCTLPLVMHGMHAKNVYAGRKYLYYSLGGAALAFMALVTVIHYSGNSNFTYGGMPALAAAPMEVLLPMFVLGFFGFATKAAVFPLHGWLPTASVAPTPVTALLHAVAVVKAGAFAVIRMAYYSFSPELMRGTWAQAFCLSVCALSIVIGSVMAVRERHLKRRLAYSTMSNLSYVLMGALMLTPEGLTGGLMHMVFHALMKISLFCCVGAIMVQTGKCYVADIRGLSRRMPFICAVFLFCAIELVGIPPFVGFQSKWALATAGLQTGGALGILCMSALIVSAILTSIYLLVPAMSTYALPLEPTAHLAERSYDPGWRMKLALGVLCVTMVVLAFGSGSIVRFLTAVAGGQL